jgi:hypothetical protein
MTPYGLNGLLTDIKCSAIYSDDIFEAIQNGDFDSFKALCRDGEIDLTEIAEIAGYIEAIYGKQLDEEPLEDEESIDSVNKDDLGYVRPLITMMGFSADSVIGDLLSLNLGQELLSELWPNANEEFAQIITLGGLDLAILYHYIGFFYDEELNEVDRILNNPLFEPFSKVAQLLFAAMFKHFPYAVKIFFTQDEQNEIATLYFKDEESGDTEQNSQTSDSDNQPAPTGQEQETIAAASFETGQENDNSSNEYVVLPEDFFTSKYPRDAKNTGQHFKVDYYVEKCGGRKFAQLINTITSWGLVSSSDAQKLVYVLSGRLKPNNYDGDGIEWIDSGYGYELLYVIKYIIGNEKGKYEKARRLFHGPQWLGKGAFKDQADYADVSFRRAFNEIYPEKCIIKGHIENV